MHANTNNSLPNPNLKFLSSKDPEIIITIPITPHITGRMWENIVVPNTAI